MTVPFGFTVTLVSRVVSGVDAYNDDTFATTSTAVPGCVFAPGSSVEQFAGGDTVSTQPTVYLPTGTSVAAVDQVIVPGYGTFEVDGDPAAWPANPLGGWQPSNSVVVKLRRVTG